MIRYFAFLLCLFLISIVSIGDAQQVSQPAPATSVPTNAALAASSTNAFPNGVWRNTFATGSGATPLFYQPSPSACTLNAGNGDNGSQVKSGDGKCWLAQFPSTGVDVLWFGADKTGGTDSHDAVQAAVNAVTGAKIIFSAGVFKICSLVTASKPIWLSGVGYQGPGMMPGRRSPTPDPAAFLVGSVTRINLCGATQSGFKITSSIGSIFENFRLSSLVPQTAGIGIELVPGGENGAVHVSSPIFRNLGFGGDYYADMNLFLPVKITAPNIPDFSHLECLGWVFACISFVTNPGVEGTGGFIAHSYFFGDPENGFSQGPAVYSEVGYANVHDNWVLAGWCGISFAVKNHPAGYIKIHDNVIENSTHVGVCISSQDGSAINMVLIQNNEFSNYAYAAAMKAEILFTEYVSGGVSQLYIKDIAIQGNIFRSNLPASAKYIWVQSGQNVDISHNQIEELGSANPYAIQWTGETVAGSFGVPVAVLDNQIIGTTNRYQANTIAASYLRDVSGTSFVGLPVVGPGSQVYVTDADPGSNPCTSVGAKTGAMAFRIGVGWKCF